MWLFIAMLVVVFSSSAYASQIGETDVFGNVIDWEYDPNGLGEDSSTDADGNSTEELEEPSLPEAYVDYTPEEQAAVLQKMEENTNPEPAENGSITVKLSTIPDGLLDDDEIFLTVYRDNVKKEISLKNDTAWITEDTLPIGHYTVYAAGTKSGSLTFTADVNSFDITSDSPVTICLSEAGTDGSMVADSSEDTDESQENCRVVVILRSDDAPDDNICVSLKNENGTCDITLTRSKSYTESVYLPAGTYTVESVSAADIDSPKAEYSAPSEIEVGADGTATIEVTVAKRLIEDSALSEDSTGEEEEVDEKESKFNVLKAASAILIGTIAGITGYMFARKKKNN